MATKSSMVYTCHVCGLDKDENNFMKSPSSPIWKDTENRVLICRNCIEKLFQEYRNRFSEEVALIACCAWFDIPYQRHRYESKLANSVEKNSELTFSKYLAGIGLSQTKGKTFIHTFIDGEFIRPDGDKAKLDIIEKREYNWSSGDKQNKNYAIAAVGYDPFLDFDFNDDDRRYCFNVLAGYCDDESVKADMHKIQSAIQITLLQLQIKKTDEMISEAWTHRPVDPDNIKQLTAIKKQLLDSSNTLANKSGLTDNTKSAGANTLSGKTKEMLQVGFEDAKVNLFTIRTCEAMKQIEDLSNQSIMEQLSFESNEWTEIVKDQREMITNLRTQNDEIAEQNRLLQNQIYDLQAQIESAQLSVLDKTGGEAT